MKRLLLLALFATPALATTDSSLSPGDFAYGMTIATPTAAAAYRVAVPLAVYQKVANPDLRDIRVFNGRGEAVPYEVEVPTPPPVTHAPGQALPFFPLRSGARAALDGLRISVQADTAAVSVQAAHTGTAADAVVAYIVDARQLTMPISAFELQWQVGAGDFTGTLRVDSSEDLASWRSVRDDAPVINLRASGAQLVQNRVDVAAQRAKFWKLTWVGTPAPFDLTAVAADTSVYRPQVERVGVTESPVESDVGHHEFRFDLGTRLPVTQVNIELPESNSAVRLEILSRARATDHWRDVTHGEFYRVQSGDTERRNEPLDVSLNLDRYWLVRLEQPNAAIGGVAPKLQASWNAVEVVFLARGGGPYILAYGNGTADAGGTVLSTLLNGLPVARAEPAGSVALGGPARALPTPRTPWKTIVLWAVLGTGTLLLAWMAYRLSRELGDSAPRAP